MRRPDNTIGHRFEMVADSGTSGTGTVLFPTNVTAELITTSFVVFNLRQNSAFFFGAAVVLLGFLKHDAASSAKSWSYRVVRKPRTGRRQYSFFAYISR